MKKADLKKLIESDLKDGMTYNAIMRKYNLKSNYLIKQVRGLKSDCEYIKINVNLKTIKKLDDEKKSSLCAYLININKILKDKNTKKLIDYIMKSFEE